MAKTTDSGFGTKLPSQQDGFKVGNVIAAALFGTTANNIEQLEQEGKKHSISDNINDLVTGATKILDAITEQNKESETIITESTSIFSEKIEQIRNAIIDTTSSLALLASAQIGQLDKIIQHIEKPSPETGAMSAQTVSIIIQGADKNVIQAIKDLANVKLSEESILSIQSVKTLHEYFTKLDELFKLQVAVSKNAVAAKNAAKITDSAIQSASDTAIQANENVETIKAGIISLNDIASFVVKIGFVMILGALFIMIPGMLTNALKYVFAISLFISSILLPIKFISSIGGDIHTTLPNLGDVARFVFIGGMIMTIGALFMLIPGMFKNSIRFGFALTIFLTSVLTPFIMLNALDFGSINNDLNNIKSLIVTSTFIMSLGAWFIMLGGGKFMKNALLFGVVLSAFITVTILPIMLMAKFIKSSIENLNDIKSFIVTATFIMALGALFMMWGNGRFVINALKFGFALMAFVGMILIPFVIASRFFKNALKSLREFTLLVTVSTIIMMIGAYIVSNKQLVQDALLFGLILGAFILCVVAPLIAASFMARAALSVLKPLALLIITSALIMMIGAYFVKDTVMVGYALGFGAILGAFIWTVLWAVTSNLKKYPAGFAGLSQVALLVAVSGLILMSGAIIMHKYGWEALAFATLLGTFVAGMLFIAKLVANANKEIVRAMFGFKQLAIGIAAVSLGISILAIIGDKYGWETILKAAGFLLAVSTILILGMRLLSSNTVQIMKGNIGAVALGIGLMSLTIAIGAMAFIWDTYGWETVLGGATTLVVVGGIFVLLFSLLGAAIAPIGIGIAAIALLAGGLGLLTLCIWGICALVENYGAENIASYPKAITDFFANMVDALLAAAGAGFTAILACISAIPLILAVAAISGVIAMIAGVIIYYRKSIEGKENVIDNIKSSIEMFIGIGDVAPSFAEYTAIKIKLAMLNDLVSLIAEVMGTMTDSIGDFAQLKIATQWDKKGRVTRYRLLNESDFQRAANSVRTIMITLSEAITTTYTKFPSLFGKDAKDILEKVSALSLTQSEILSTLSDGVQKYANLLIPTAWNNKGVAIRYRVMNETDFENAAKGVEKILTTLSGAIATTYKLHKTELFDSNDFNKILSKMSALSITEGIMLYSISEGLKSYATLRIPKKFNNNGVPYEFEEMTDKHFIAAARNISTVMTLMSNAIVGVWRGGKTSITVYDENGTPKVVNFDSGTGVGAWASIIDTIAESMMPIGDLISNISNGIMDYAFLKIPTAFDRKGKGTAFKPMSSTDFSNAAINISTIMSLVSATIYKLWTGADISLKDAQGKELLDMPVLTGGGRWWRGKDGLRGAFGSDEFKEIMDGFGNIGNLISNIADGITTYSKLMIPIYGSNGKVVNARPLSSTDFRDAGKNIASVLMAVLIGDAVIGSREDIKNVNTGIIGAYNLLNELNIDDDLADIMQQFSSVGTFIGNMSEGISNYAKLMIPNKWDKEGKPIDYEPLNSTMIIKASENIVSVLMSIIGVGTNGENEGGILAVYKKLQEHNLENKIGEIIQLFAPVSSLIADMASGVAKMATMQVADRWNAEGKATHYIKLTDAEFKAVGSNVAHIVTALAQSLMDLVNNESYKKYFGEDADIAFKTVVDSVSNVGNIIKDIADGINTLAKGGIPTYDSEGKIVGYTQFKPNDIEVMKTNVATMIGGMVDAVIAAGTIISNSDADFDNVSKSISNVGGMLKNIAEGIQAWANMKIPTGWDKEGNAIGYRKLIDNDITDAKKNIITIVKTLVEAIVEAHDTEIQTSKGTYRVGDFVASEIASNVIKTNEEITKVIKGVVDIVKGLSDFIIPSEYNPDGTVKSYIKLSKEAFDNAKYTELITHLITALPNAIVSASNELNKSKQTFDTSVANVINTLSRTAQVLPELLNIVNILATSKESINAILSDVDKKTNNVSLLKDIETIINSIKIVTGNIFSEENMKSVPDNINANLAKWIALIQATGKMLNNINENIIPVVTDTKFISGIATILTKKYTVNRKDTDNKPYSEQTSIIGAMTSVLEELNELAKTANGTVNSPRLGVNLSVLGEGLQAVVVALNSYKYNNGFNKAAADVDAFLKKFDGTNETRFNNIDKLLKLTESLNKLADKTTNLDKLTEAISDKLTVTLENLVQRMDESKQVIAQTETIQQKRHEIIAKIIREIKGFVSAPIDVVISVKDNNNESEYADGGGSLPDTVKNSTSLPDGIGGGTTVITDSGTGTGAPMNTTTPTNTNDFNSALSALQLSLFEINDVVNKIYKGQHKLPIT